MKDIWNYLKKSENPIVLYGMGDGADKILNACNNYQIPVSGVFASDEFVRKGKKFCGFEVCDYRSAKERFGKMTVLLCFGTALDNVILNIKKISSENELFAPDVPVVDGPIFNFDFYECNKEKIETVKNLLADDVSKKCFENLIKYKLSGNINFLFECQTEKSETLSFFKFEKGENYIDLGAYRGDTVFEFVENVGNYESIIAVEPDKKTFEKLLRNTKNIKNLSAINAAVCERDGYTEFSMNGSRGSKFGKGERIKSVSVDKISENVPTFIKMDVEGAEMAAIIGAEKTIKQYRPKMQIAAYHKSEDIFSLPLKVLEFCPDYKVYLRHFPCLPAWDTNYYFLPDQK